MVTSNPKKWLKHSIVISILLTVRSFVIWCLWIWLCQSVILNRKETRNSNYDPSEIPDSSLQFNNILRRNFTVCRVCWRQNSHLKLRIIPNNWLQLYLRLLVIVSAVSSIFLNIFDKIDIILLILSIVICNLRDSISPISFITSTRSNLKRISVMC